MGGNCSEVETCSVEIFVYKIYLEIVKFDAQLIVRRLFHISAFSTLFQLISPLLTSVCGAMFVHAFITVN